MASHTTCCNIEGALGIFQLSVYKLFRRKEFDDEYFILLSTDYNDTADSAEFCEKYLSTKESPKFGSKDCYDCVCGNKNEDHHTESFKENKVGESTIFSYRDCRYIADSQKASQVELLIIGELKNVPIVKEFKVVNGFMGVWTLCSADEAIRMCLASKRFRLCFRKTVSFCLIEHMPLITDTYWITKVFSGVPLYLTAKGNEQLSSVLTLLLIILDFTYNLWVPAVEKASLVFVRLVQLVLSHLSTNLRFLVFYLLSNFDNKFLPCSITDFKVKTERTRVFYTTDNTVLNCPDCPDCPDNGISQETFDEVDTTQEKFSFEAKAFNVEISKEQSNNGLVEFKLELKGVLYDLVKATYKMTEDNFRTYIGCWMLLQNNKIGLVQTVEKGMLFRNMHLFGFEETIDLFWDRSKVNVYKVEVKEEHRYLIAGENHKNYLNFDKMESSLYLAIARKWGCGSLAAVKALTERKQL
ncbi:hypothetical protein SUGI_0134540 [Cryptomeria japonica]|nr:hypothetical protein SUGI_0134540 [Cryptomeria japonica]